MFVRLMADYCSDGVWNKQGVMIDRDSLPISDQLNEDIALWCRDFEVSEYYLDELERHGVFDLEAFNVKGAALAERLAGELLGWEVVYQPYTGT